MSKYAYAYFGSDGQLKEFILDPSVRQGNQGINQIYVYWENPVDCDYVAQTYINTDLQDAEWSTPEVIEETGDEFFYVPVIQDYDPKYFKYGKKYENTETSKVLLLTIPSGALVDNANIALSLLAFEDQDEDGEYDASDAQVMYLGIITFHVKGTGATFPVTIDKSQFYILLDRLNVKLEGFEETVNKVTSLSSSSTDTEYPSAKCVYDRLALKEDLANKVTSISAYSTNTQYPSAKCVWDNLQNVRELAEGKCKAMILSTEDTITGLNHSYYEEPVIAFYVYDSSTNKFVNRSPEFRGGMYDSYSLVNSIFDTTDSELDTLSYKTDFILLRADAFERTYYLIKVGDLQYYLHRGDILYIIETGIPDRWFDGATIFYALDAKTDLSGYFAKSADLIPTSNGTQDIGNSWYQWNNLYLDNELHLGSSGIIKYDSNAAAISVNDDIIPAVSNSYTLGSGSFYWREFYTYNVNIGVVRIWNSSTTLITNGSIRPSTNDRDLGTSSYAWKDLYLSGKAYLFGNNDNWNLEADNAYNQLRIAHNNTRHYTFNDNGFMPTGTKDLGSISYAWKNLYLSGNLIDGTNSYSVAEGMAQFNYNETGSTEIKWTKMLYFTKIADETFTFETPKTNCLNEYKAIIANTGSNAITITLPSGVSIETNDDTITISNNTFVLPAGVVVEFNCVNNWCIIYNHSAQ